MDTNHSWIFVVADDENHDTYADYFIKQLKENHIDVGVEGLSSSQNEITSTQKQHAKNENALSIKKFFGHDALSEFLNNQLERKPNIVVLIGPSPKNLPIAKKAHTLNIPVIYFIPPQICTLNKSKINALKKYCTHIICLYNFETQLFKEHGIDAVTTAHPLFETVIASEQYENGQIAIHPGFKQSEINMCLPTILNAIERIKAVHPQCTFSIIVAKPRLKSVIQRCLLDHPDLKCDLIEHNIQDHLKQCHLAIVINNSMTVPLTLMTTPMIVVHRESWFSKVLSTKINKVKHFALPNRIANKTIVPELLQDKMHANQISKHALKLLENPKNTQSVIRLLENIRKNLSKVHEKPLPTLIKSLLS